MGLELVMKPELAPPRGNKPRAKTTTLVGEEGGVGPKMLTEFGGGAIWSGDPSRCSAGGHDKLQIGLRPLGDLELSKSPLGLAQIPLS